ncbi:MAG: hypothetical protein M5U25_15850 [Planctomycetota bacterium]|nr:hypothetical protein [Planctomycetota bacterium]
MTFTSKHGATTRRARLAVLATFTLVILAGCTGGGGSASGLPANYAPPTGGGGGTTNSAPVFTSSAPTSATVGVLYSYQAAAADADGDP